MAPELIWKRGALSGKVQQQPNLRRDISTNSSLAVCECHFAMGGGQNRITRSFCFARFNSQCREPTGERFGRELSAFHAQIGRPETRHPRCAWESRLLGTTKRKLYVSGILVRAVRVDNVETA